MPRSTEKSYTRVLNYFKTAPMAEIGIVLDMVKAEVKGREIAAHKPGPKPAPIAMASPAAAPVSHKKKPGPKPKAKVAAASAAPAKTKKKPGPKPGSHRKQTAVNALPAATAHDEPTLLDRIEAVEEVPDVLPPQTLDAEA